LASFYVVEHLGDRAGVLMRDHPMLVGLQQVVDQRRTGRTGIHEAVEVVQRHRSAQIRHIGVDSLSGANATSYLPK
jgi:hypothetical protein